MHLGPTVAWAAVLSKAVVQLLLTFCLLLLPLWESVIVLCFVVRYFMSILVLQSSWWGRESWLLCLICLPGVSWWLSGSSSRCHGVVCSLWLWYFLIILTIFVTKFKQCVCRSYLQADFLASQYSQQQCFTLLFYVKSFRQSTINTYIFVHLE